MISILEVFRFCISTLILCLQQSLTSGVNPFIQNWMFSMTLRQLETFVPTITVTEGEISHYIVYKQTGRPSAAGVPKPAAKSKAKPAPAAGQPATLAAKSSSTGSGKRDPPPVRAPSPKRTSQTVVEAKEPVNGQPMETSSPARSSPGASGVCLLFTSNF